MEKAELVIFKHQRKNLDTEIKIKLNKKRLYPSSSIRYLGIKIDQNLNWKDHINDIAVKLNRANVLLFKIKNFVNIIILKTIYFPIFDSHINYANLVWAQNSHVMSRILTLQKKAMRFLLSNQGTAIQVLFFRNLNYLNSVIKSILKMCF